MTHDPARPVRLPRRLAPLVSLGFMVAVVGACSALPRLPDPVIDGLRIGDRHDCSPAWYYDCAELATIAITHLDQASPDHAEVAGFSVHGEGTADVDDGREILTARSGTFVIVVFDLVDGSRRAVGVYCGVGGCHAMDGPGA